MEITREGKISEWNLILLIFNEYSSLDDFIVNIITNAKSIKWENFRERTVFTKLEK